MGGGGSAAVCGIAVAPATPSFTLCPDVGECETVSFDIGAAATDVAASLTTTATAATWVDCTEVGVTTVWTCDYKAGSAPAGGTFVAAGNGWPVATDTTLTVAAVSTGVVNIGSQAPLHRKSGPALAPAPP